MPSRSAAVPLGRGPVRATARALTLVLVIAALAILVDPAHRATTARVALLAMGMILAIGLVQVASRRTPAHPASAQPASPFDPQPAPAPDPDLPLDLLRLASDAERSLHPAATGLVTGVLDETVRAIAVQRLDHHHGITVAATRLADDDAAARHLGPATTALLARRGRGRNDRRVGPLDPLGIARELEAL
jgi:hypothetical protein